MPPKKLRRAGADWRVLVHEPDGKTHDIRSTPYTGRQHDLEVRHPIPGAEFDEVVVGEFLHAEMMDTGHWWVSLGGVVANIWADPDGRPQRIDVYEPRDYDDAREGVEYRFTWHGHTSVYSGESKPLRHEYLSTACWHAVHEGKPELHDSCRATCKWCGSSCSCAHHQAERDRPVTNWVDQARNLARELLEHAALPPELAERIRTDPALFWARGEEQPPGEWAG